MQRRRVHDGVRAREQRRQPGGVLDVRDLGRERPGTQVETDDLVTQLEPRRNGAANPPRRSCNEDLHASRVAKLTRRPMRQVSS